MSSHANQNFPGQQDGEDVQLVFRQHPLVMRKPLIIGLLLILFAVLPLDFIYTGWLFTILVKVALAVSAAVLFLYWPYHFLGWYYSVYIVTDRRLIEIKQHGLFDRKVREWQLDLIQNLNYHINGFQAVIFHYGTITAETYSGNLEMPTIYKPVEVHTRLMEIVRRARPSS